MLAACHPAGIGSACAANAAAAAATQKANRRIDTVAERFIASLLVAGRMPMLKRFRGDGEGRRVSEGVSVLRAEDVGAEPVAADHVAVDLAGGRIILDVVDGDVPD